MDQAIAAVALAAFVFVPFAVIFTLELCERS